jgi:hypothetical protein
MPSLVQRGEVLGGRQRKRAQAALPASERKQPEDPLLGLEHPQNVPCLVVVEVDRQVIGERQRLVVSQPETFEYVARWGLLVSSAPCETPRRRRVGDMSRAQDALVASLKVCARSPPGSCRGRARPGSLRRETWAETRLPRRLVRRSVRHQDTSLEPSPHVYQCPSKWFNFRPRLALLSSGPSLKDEEWRAQVPLPWTPVEIG